jgi:uncharacterized protein (TIGR03067 family)
MKRAQSDHRQAARISRRAFTAGLILLVPGIRLRRPTTTLANDDARRPSTSTVADDKSDQEKMQGKWRIVHCEFAGQDSPQPVGVEDTIDGARWLRPNRRTGEYQLKFDPSKDPKWVDLSAERLGSQTLKGIYLLDGDKLTICYAYDPDLPRPTEFKTRPDFRGYIYVLERVKKE